MLVEEVLGLDREDFEVGVGEETVRVGVLDQLRQLDLFVFFDLAVGYPSDVHQFVDALRR